MTRHQNLVTSISPQSQVDDWQGDKVPIVTSTSSRTKVDDQKKKKQNKKQQIHDPKWTAVEMIWGQTLALMAARRRQGKSRQKLLVHKWTSSLSPQADEFITTSTSGRIILRDAQKLLVHKWTDSLPSPKVDEFITKSTKWTSLLLSPQNGRIYH